MSTLTAPFARPLRKRHPAIPGLGLSLGFTILYLSLIHI